MTPASAPRCPDHARALTPRPQGRVCPFCQGAFTEAEALEARCPGAGALLSLETRPASPVFLRPRLCPDCAVVMVPQRIAQQEAWVERCPDCAGLWVEAADERTLQQLLLKARRQAAWKSFSPQEREEMASGLAERPKQEELVADVTVGDAALAVAGVPVLSKLEGEGFPVQTLALTGVLVALFVGGLIDPDSFGFEVLGWSPRVGLSWSLLTAQAVHLGWAHLLGNVAFLLAFGNAVEKKLPAWAYLPAFLGLGVAATLAQALVSEGHALIGGASAGIAGFMGLSVFLQPHARLKLFLIGWVAVPVPLWVAIGVRLAWEVTMAALGEPGVAFMAHAAGLALGLLGGWWLTRKR